MEPAVANAPRHIAHGLRHHTARLCRVDRPTFERGAPVWWKAGLYKVERLELQGQSWYAILVHPAEFGEVGVRCWFAPAHEIQLDGEG